MELTHIQTPYPLSDMGIEIETPHPRLESSWCEGGYRCGRGAPGNQHCLPASLRGHPHLPYEIICRIFLESRSLNVTAPTIVSHVCRNWRQIAFSQCGLWTNIELDCKQVRLDRASAWAKRAGHLPISLKIRYSEYGDPRSIITWLQEMENRVKSVTVLHLGVTDNGVLTSFPPLKHMESFQIVGIDELAIDLKWIAQILKGSPRLSSMAWSGVGGLHFPGSLTGFTSTLTHLSIGANSYVDYAFPLWIDAILDVIATCTGLTSLECHALGKGDDCEPQTVSLPFLSSLTIGDGPETCLILKYLYTPMLCMLRLVGGNDLNEKEEVVDMPDMEFDRDGYVHLLIDCIRHLHETCSPPLAKVVWDRTVININVLHHCAPYLRGMEELRCHEIGDIPPSILALGAEVTDLSFPRLRNMIFTKCTIKAESLNTVQSLIMKDVAHLSPLEELVVEDCLGISDIYFRRT